MAASLGISRNTVSAAYKELEIEGLLVSLQGRGTFVAGDSSEKEKPGRKSRLLKVIDLALGEAAKLGFGPDDFLSLATARALEQKESLAAVNLAFVGTSQEQISYFNASFCHNRCRLHLLYAGNKEYPQATGNLG